MASSPLTRFDDMASPWSRVELGVKADYAENLASGNVETLRDMVQNPLGKIPVDFLRFLQNGNERSFLSLVFLKNLFKASQIVRFCHFFLLIEFEDCLTASFQKMTIPRLPFDGRIEK
jgi:hypothetical protein